MRLLAYGYFHLLKDNFIDNNNYYLQIVPNLILVLPILIILATLIGRAWYLKRNKKNLNEVEQENKKSINS